ncbi:MAG: type II secretion system protein GspJ [Leptospira sp.]|nr:type II secretion system protein GspJ [Leptospira sp.]
MKIFSAKYRKGVNLVELAVVMMVLGVLFTGIFGAYYTALKISQNSSPKNAAAKRDVFTALENLRSSFAQAFFLPGQKRLIFIAKGEGPIGGRRDTVTFASSHANSEETGNPAVREVSFYLKKMTKNDDYYYLIRREDEMVDQNPEKGGLEHIILEYVKSFQLKYSVRGDKWQDEWDTKDTQKIPKLIRVELIVKTGNKEQRFETLSYPGIYFK